MWSFGLLRSRRRRPAPVSRTDLTGPERELAAALGRFVPADRLSRAFAERLPWLSALLADGETILAAALVARRYGESVLLVCSDRQVLVLFGSPQDFLGQPRAVFVRRLARSAIDGVTLAEPRSGEWLLTIAGKNGRPSIVLPFIATTANPELPALVEQLRHGTSVGLAAPADDSRSPVPVASELERLAALRRSGAISDEEFRLAKRRLLS